MLAKHSFKDIHITQDIIWKFLWWEGSADRVG